MTSWNYLNNLFKNSSFKLRYIVWSIGPILVYVNANEQTILVQYCKPILGQWNLNIGLILDYDYDYDVVWDVIALPIGIQLLHHARSFCCYSRMSIDHGMPGNLWPLVWAFLAVECQRRWILTGGNWQKWKRVFLTCHCHTIYRDKVVGLKSWKNTWKLRYLWKCEIWGYIVKIWYFVNNCLIKARI